MENYYEVDTDEFVRLCRNLKLWRDSRHLKMSVQLSCLMGNALEELTELARAKSAEEAIDALCDICIYALNSKNMYSPWKIYPMDTRFADFASQILNAVESKDIGGIVCLCFSRMFLMGYDPLKCLEQTIFEISSRTGEFDKKLGKFVKDAGFYSIEDAKQFFPDRTIIENSDSFDVWDDDKECFTYVKWYKANYSICGI